MKQDPFELALFLTGDEENWEDAIEEKYSISYGDFEALVNDFLPLAEKGVSALSGRLHRGFADTKNKQWLLKIEANT